MMGASLGCDDQCGNLSGPKNARRRVDRAPPGDDYVEGWARLAQCIPETTIVTGQWRVDAFGCPKVFGDGPECAGADNYGVGGST
jgi:hypothetical protein